MDVLRSATGVSTTESSSPSFQVHKKQLRQHSRGINGEGGEERGIKLRHSIGSTRQAIHRSSCKYKGVKVTATQQEKNGEVSPNASKLVSN